MLGKKRNQSVFLEGETSTAARVLEETVPVPKACTKEETDMAESKEAVVITVLEESEHKKRDVLRTHDLFFSAEDDSKDFSAVLRDVQEHISGKYSTLLTSGNTEEVKEHIKRYITKYVQDSRVAVKGMTNQQLVDALYTEMAEFSFLTKYIFGKGIEEIDINGWNDIEVQYSGGKTEKLNEHFDSPEHAINVVRRMLHVSGVVLDNASPLVT